MAAPSPRSTIDALLEREALQASSVAPGGGASLGGPCRPPRRVNAVWRRKVVRWYFSLTAALRRRHRAAGGRDDLFDRASVHVAASLLDGHLASLPEARARRYQRDRRAYQLLATTCLLVGMRLARRDRGEQVVAGGKRKADGGKDAPRGLKRAKTHRANMNEAPSIVAGGTPPPPAVGARTHRTNLNEAPSSSGTAIAAGGNPPTPAAGIAIPNATTLLRISRAPASMSERHVLRTVREMTASQAFPRSEVVTSLDFIQALCASRTEVREDGSPVALGPTDAEEASRLADAAAGDAGFVGCRPSVVACAAVVLALARCNVNLSMASLRQTILRSVFGDEGDLELRASVRKAETDLLTCVREARLPASSNRPSMPTAHLIPLEDES